MRRIQLFFSLSLSASLLPVLQLAYAVQDMCTIRFLDSSIADVSTDLFHSKQIALDQPAPVLQARSSD